jgi:hypothetical protein
MAKVRVTISDEEGNTLEQGDAARVYDAWKKISWSKPGTWPGM